jgi:hypothetical protein
VSAAVLATHFLREKSKTTVASNSTIRDFKASNNTTKALLILPVLLNVCVWAFEARWLGAAQSDKFSLSSEILFSMRVATCGLLFFRIYGGWHLSLLVLLADFLSLAISLFSSVQISHVFLGVLLFMNAAACYLLLKYKSNYLKGASD